MSAAASPGQDRSPPEAREAEGVVDNVEASSTQAFLNEMKNEGLRHAVRQGTLDEIRSCVEEGADINHYQKLPAHGRGTVLHLVCDASQTFAQPARDILELLLELRADPRARTTTGYTPMHSCPAEFIEPLLGAGADINAADNAGGTPLDVAAFARQSERFAKLLELKADPAGGQGRGSLRWRPLHWAVYYGDMDMVEALFQAGAAVDPMDLEGQSPLMMEILESPPGRANAEIVRRLLDANAMVDYLNFKVGYSFDSISLAKGAKQEHLLPLLREARKQHRFKYLSPEKQAEFLEKERLRLEKAEAKEQAKRARQEAREQAKKARAEAKAQEKLEKAAARQRAYEERYAAKARACEERKQNQRRSKQAQPAQQQQQEQNQDQELLQEQQEQHQDQNQEADPPAKRPKLGGHSNPPPQEAPDAPGSGRE